jgi:hypothetical protein
MTARVRNPGEPFVYLDGYLVRASEHAVLVEIDHRVHEGFCAGYESWVPMSAIEDPDALLHAKPLERVSVGVARWWARAKGWGAD